MKALQRTSKLLLLILCGIAMLYPVSGLAVSCKHEETFTQSSYFCHSIDDNFHEFYDYVVIKCRNFECLEIISSETKNYTREKHQFQNNGKCKVCDYQRASGHKCQFGSGLSSGLIEVSSEVVRRDSTYCYYKRYQVIKCLVCGHIMEEIFEDDVRYGHSFSAGKCSRCGFEKEAFCLHSNKTSYYDSTIPPIFSNITPTHHNVRNGYKMICDDCGANTGETGHFETVTEAHSLNNGKCVCGYTQSSTPTVTSRPTTPSGDHNCAYSSNTKKTYYKHNETQHWQYTEVKCYICGNDMYVRNPEGEREEHRFENGTCKVCGYQGECYLTVDQGHISGLVAHVTGGQGATINVSSNVAWTVTEDLNWVTVHNITGNGNGSFTVYVDANTGYAREGVITVYGSPCESISIRITQEGAVVDPTTCEHDYGYDYDQAKDGVWEKVDANTHKRTKLRYTYVCTICGHSYEDYGPDDANVVEDHDWGKTSWTRWLTNEKEHCHKGKQTCTAPGCGATKNVSETEEHAFVDGKCVCGVEKSKKATQSSNLPVVGEQPEANNANFEDGDDEKYTIEVTYTDSEGNSGTIWPVSQREYIATSSSTLSLTLSLKDKSGNTPTDGEFSWVLSHPTDRMAYTKVRSGSSVTEVDRDTGGTKGVTEWECAVTKWNGIFSKETLQEFTIIVDRREASKKRFQMVLSGIEDYTFIDQPGKYSNYDIRIVNSKNVKPKVAFSVVDIENTLNLTHEQYVGGRYQSDKDSFNFFLTLDSRDSGSKRYGLVNVPAGAQRLASTCAIELEPTFIWKVGEGMQYMTTHTVYLWRDDQIIDSYSIDVAVYDGNYVSPGEELGALIKNMGEVAQETVGTMILTLTAGTLVVVDGVVYQVVEGPSAGKTLETLGTLSEIGDAATEYIVADVILDDFVGVDNGTSHTVFGFYDGISSMLNPIDATLYAAEKQVELRNVLSDDCYYEDTVKKANGLFTIIEFVAD